MIRRKYKENIKKTYSVFYIVEYKIHYPLNPPFPLIYTRDKLRNQANKNHKHQ